jgi:hypothetical protein
MQVKHAALPANWAKQSPATPRPQSERAASDFGLPRGWARRSEPPPASTPPPASSPPSSSAPSSNSPPESHVIDGEEHTVSVQLTAEMLDRLASTPFAPQENEAGPPPSAATPPEEDMGGLTMDGSVILGKELPFLEQELEPQREQHGEARGIEQQPMSGAGTPNSSGPDRSGAAPIGNHRTSSAQPDATPASTRPARRWREVLVDDSQEGLEQYASLCAQCRLYPRHAAQLNAKYGLDAEERVRVDDLWRGRFEARSEQHEAFEQLMRSYEAWFTRQTR